MVKKKIAVIMATVALVASLSITYFVLLPSEEPPILQVLEYTTFSIDENGNASCESTTRIPPSDLADFIRVTIRGGTFRGIPMRGYENAERTFIESLRSAYAPLGWDVKDPTCEISGLEPGQTLEITLTWKIPHLSRRRDNAWSAGFQPVDAEEYAKEQIDDIRSFQAALLMIAPDSEIIITEKSTFILPEGAEVLNENELVELVTQAVDYGRGTHGESTLRVEDIEGRAAVVIESQSLIKSQPITITAQELLQFLRPYSIEYSGAPIAEFTSSVVQIFSDIKYGRELENRYSVTIDGMELDLTPSQILYYSAKETINLAEGGNADLLPDNQLLTVAPPNDENGDWGAIWKNITREVYVDNLARGVYNAIELTGRAPASLQTPIGKMRFDDALHPC